MKEYLVVSESIVSPEDGDVHTVWASELHRLVGDESGRLTVSLELLRSVVPTPA